MKFTVTWCLTSEKRSAEMAFFKETRATTFQCNSSGVSKLIRLEIDQNFSNAYIEKRSLDGQFGTGVGPNTAARKQSISEDDSKYCVTDMSRLQ